MSKYKYVCEICGSDNVNCSGPLRWDYDKQEWTNDGSTFDDDYCEDCEREVRLIQVFSTEEETQAPTTSVQPQAGQSKPSSSDH